MPNLVPAPEDALPERFLEQARAAMLDGRTQIDFSPKLLIQIASSTYLRGRFVDLIKNINDEDLKKIILDHVRDLSEGLEHSTSGSETFIDLIDRAGFPVATGAVGLGIGLLVSTGIVLGTVAVFSGGLIGLGLCGAGRSLIKFIGNKNKFAVVKLKRLTDDLK